MHYHVIVYNKRREPTWLYDNFLDGLIPSETLELMRCHGALCSPTIHDRGLCEHCTMDTHCHIIDPSGRKYCPVLFHDAVKPPWRLEDLV